MHTLTIVIVLVVCCWLVRQQLAEVCWHNLRDTLVVWQPSSQHTRFVRYL